MNTLTERIGEMIKADAEMVQECAALLAESASRMCRAQLETANRACSETARQYREMMSGAEAASILNDWPKAFEANLRSATEATNACLEGAIELQSGLIRILHSHLPVLNRRFFESVGEATRVARSVGTAELVSPPGFEDEEEDEPARQSA